MEFAQVELKPRLGTFDRVDQRAHMVFELHTPLDYQLRHNSMYFVTRKCK